MLTTAEVCLVRPEAQQHIGDIIDPRDVCPRVINSLEMSANKQEELPAKKTRPHAGVSTCR